MRVDVDIDVNVDCRQRRCVDAVAARLVVADAAVRRLVRRICKMALLVELQVSDFLKLGLLRIQIFILGLYTLGLSVIGLSTLEHFCLDIFTALFQGAQYEHLKLHS